MNSTNDRIQFLSLYNYDGNFSCVPLPSETFPLMHLIISSHACAQKQRESATTDQSKQYEMEMEVLSVSQGKFSDLISYFVTLLVGKL